MSKISGLLLGLLSVLILAGCAQQGTQQGTGPYGGGTTAQGGGGAAAGNGLAVFTITDKAADMGNVTSVKLTIDSVQIHSAASGWMTLSSATQTFDLLQLKASDAQALLAQANLSNGTYEQVRLHVSKVVVTDSSGDHEAKLPSGDLKIAGGFTVSGNKTSVATFDFLADQSLHVTGNGQYIMAPVIHLQTRENASVDASNSADVRVSGGSVRDDIEVGMDENGTIAAGARIPDNADVSIDGSGNVKVGVPPAANVSSNGRVVVGVKDKTANLSSVSSINVTIDSVSVHGSGGDWVTLSSAPKTFDLLGLNANGSEQLLADANVSNGTYQQIRLEISSVMVTDANGTHAAKLPSGELRLVGPLVVGGNSTSTVTLDFLANESLHMTGNGEYILAPVLRLETTHNATVSVNAAGEVSGSGETDADNKQGMDENGTVSVGGGIPPDVNVSIGSDGHVSVVHGGSPGKPLVNVTGNASIVGSMD